MRAWAMIPLTLIRTWREKKHRARLRWTAMAAIGIESQDLKPANRGPHMKAQPCAGKQTSSGTSTHQSVGRSGVIPKRRLCAFSRNKTILLRRKQIKFIHEGCHCEGNMLLQNLHYRRQDRERPIAFDLISVSIFIWKLHHCCFKVVRK